MIESEEGITDVYFIRFDFFHRSEYKEILSHLHTQYNTSENQYEDKHTISYTRTGEHFTNEDSISNPELRSFSSLSTFLKNEIKIDTYRYKSLENFYYLVTVAQLSENQVDDLNNSDSPRKLLTNWKENIEGFVENPSLIRIEQDKIPTHTILGFSGKNPLYLRNQDEQKEIIPKWISQCNINTEPRFFVFGFNPEKPCSILDQKLIICAGDTPLEPIFGIYFQGDRNKDSEHTEPALLEPFDHIVLQILIIYCGSWRINNIEKYSSKIDKILESNEERMNHEKNIRRLNNLENVWEDLHRAIKSELDEFDQLIQVFTSDRSFIRIPETEVQGWRERHISVENELNGHSMIEALYAYAVGTTAHLRKFSQEIDNQRKRKSEITDTRIDREDHLREDHWVKRPKVQIVTLIVTLLGGVVATDDLFSLALSVSDIIYHYLIYVPDIVYISAIIILSILSFWLFRYSRPFRQ